MAPDTADSYFMLDFRSSKGLIATTSVFMIFTDVFLYGLVIPVFPFALEERVGVPKEELHQAISLLIGITGFGILVGSPFCGWISEKCATRRYPLLFGLCFLFISTCLIRFGTALWVIVLGRLFGGFAAAMTWVVGQALLVDRVEEDETGRYLGLLSVSANLALFIGPILGGMVYERAGYNAVFDMALLLILFDIGLRSFVIEPKMLKQILSRTNTPKRSPSPGGSSATETSPLLSDVTTVVSKPGDDNTITSSDEEDEERRAAENVWIPLLTSGRLLNAIWGTLLQAALSSALETTLPLFAKSEFGYGSEQSGWLFTTLVIPGFSAPLMGYLRDRVFHPHAIIFVGFLLVSPLFVALGFMSSNPLPSAFFAMVVDADPHRVALTCVILLSYGLASSLLCAPISAEFPDAVRDLERKKKLIKGGKGLGIAFSMNSAAYAAGAMMGPFVGGLVKGRWGWKVMTFVLAGISLLGCVPLVFLWISNKASGGGSNEAMIEEDDDTVVTRTPDTQQDV